MLLSAGEGAAELGPDPTVKMNDEGCAAASSLFVEATLKGRGGEVGRLDADKPWRGLRSIYAQRVACFLVAVSRAG